MQKEARHPPALEGKRSRGLLTHHQPNGRSPALEKGGYVARRAGALVQKEARHPPALEEKRSRGLLTHHQPIGWSPALAKGGYTLGLAPIAFWQVLRR